MKFYFGCISAVNRYGVVTTACTCIAHSQEEAIGKVLLDAHKRWPSPEHHDYMAQMEQVTKSHLQQIIDIIDD